MPSLHGFFSTALLPIYVVFYILITQVRLLIYVLPVLAIESRMDSQPFYYMICIIEKHILGLEVSFVAACVSASRSLSLHMGVKLHPRDILQGHRDKLDEGVRTLLVGGDMRGKSRSPPPPPEWGRL